MATVTTPTPDLTHVPLPDWLTRQADGRLLADGQDLESLANTYGTPLYVYSRSHIEATLARFKAALAGRQATICYALKANSNLAIIELMGQLGCGYDIVSGGELDRVLAAGGKASDVVFSGVGKSVPEIEQALTLGVRCFNVESTAELARLNAIAGRLGRRAPVSLRVNPDVDASTHPYISTGLRENKFGIPYDEARAVYRTANEAAHLDVVGIDCHIGSQITDITPFLAALDRLLALVDALKADGVPIHHLDLGGGLGIRYSNETPPEPAVLMDALFKRLDQWSGGKPPPVMFEFGRALVGNAGLLLTRTEYLKQNGDKHFAVVDASMTELIRPTLYQGWHRIEAVRQRATTPTRRYDIVGPVCESGDWLGRDRPLAVEAGDLLVILSAGAYGSVMSSNYNTRPRPAEILIDGGRAAVIREREKIASLFALERRLG